VNILEVGTWNVANGVPAPAARAAVAGVWAAHPELDVLALQEMHGRRLEPLDGVGCYHPNGSEGEDDNALMWSTRRFELLDAYALLLSDAGWRTVRGGMAPRRVAPVVLLREVSDGSRHAFASIHLPPSLETPDGINREARTRLAVAGGSLRRLRNHADGLCLLGFEVHVGGDWNVNSLADDGAHDEWPEAALGDLLTSAWRAAGAGGSPATFGDAARMIDDWRTTARVESVRSLDTGPSDHRLVVARLAVG
jgi:hypothetical protein